MSSRWKKKNAPMIGQVWRCNASPQDGAWLVLDEARMGWAQWNLTLLNLESGEVRNIAIKRNHESWERIA